MAPADPHPGGAVAKDAVQHEGPEGAVAGASEEEENERR
jgi:hypothetical protein